MKKAVHRKTNPSKKNKTRFPFAPVASFVIIQLTLCLLLVFYANRWYAAMWTLISFDNIFVTASLVTCGLTTISIVAMLTGLILILAGKKAGRTLVLVALSAAALGSIFLGGVVIWNAIVTNTAMMSMTTLYFMPMALVLANGIAGTVFLLRSEGLKEYFAYRAKPKYEPPRPGLPETRLAASGTSESAFGIASVDVATVAGANSENDGRA